MGIKYVCSGVKPSAPESGVVVGAGGGVGKGGHYLGFQGLGEVGEEEEKLGEVEKGHGQISMLKKIKV